MLAALLMLSLLGVPPSTPIPPQVECEQYTEVAAMLQRRYDETIVAYGTLSPVILLQIYASDSRGSFTIIVVDMQGCAHFVAAGQNWSGMPRQEKLEP